MVKRISSLLLSGALTLVLLAGCSPKQEKSESSKTSDRKEITLMIPEWGVPSDEMLAEFKKESGITVKVLPTAWDDIKNKVSIASAAKKAPADVIEVDWSWSGEFKTAGWLEKLDVDSETQKDIPSISYFKFGNDIYSIPYANGLRLAYMNKEMMDKAGISEVPKNWSDMESAMKKLKASKVSEYPYLFPLHAEEKTTTSFLTLAYTRNGKVFNNDDTLNKESVLDTLKTIDRYVKEGYITPDSVSKPGIDTFRGINNADGAFLLGPTSFITSSNDPKVSKVVGKITVIPMPSIDGPAKNTISFTEAVGISTFSENKESAKKFVEWFSRPETQLALNKAINNTPTRTSVIEKMVKDGIIKTPGSIVEQSKIVNTPFPNGVPKYYTEMSTEIFNIINQLGKGNLTPEKATDTMVEKVQKLIDERK
ncbi:sugar ABC transporter substrate-binding protein [Peptostreptococcus sp. D1]|uniref:sugar ABC transporter substrate-binding protein n=1 Tax=Peptostreptococcus sp. D1 TaxID=72304 RepID=UPI0008E79EA5|nr:extracellular solute-binding protein [Peptostreptococcus sp. D1]SFE14823.1 multiple sugar transport system substrate-binding protein [Peptostreptococcus sp. D1]